VQQQQPLSARARARPITRRAGAGSVLRGPPAPAGPAAARASAAAALCLPRAGQRREPGSRRAPTGARSAGAAARPPCLAHGSQAKDASPYGWRHTQLAAPMAGGPPLPRQRPAHLLQRAVLLLIPGPLVGAESALDAPVALLDHLRGAQRGAVGARGRSGAARSQPSAGAQHHAAPSPLTRRPLSSSSSSSSSSRSQSPPPPLPPAAGGCRQLRRPCRRAAAAAAQHQTAPPHSTPAQRPPARPPHPPSAAGPRPAPPSPNCSCA
jgi:hypothetical protein